MHAELLWVEKTARRVAKPSDLTVSADYTFRNAGSAPVKITSIATSCGCTTTQLDQQSFAPGATGKLTAVFEIGSRSGPQEKTITVVADDGVASTTTLVFRVDIPELVTLAPRLLVWSRGGDNAEKEVTFAAAGDIEARLIDVQSADRRFKIERFVDAPGRKYRFKVAPASTAAEMLALIEIKYETVIGHPQTLSVAAAVR